MLGLCLGLCLLTLFKKKIICEKNKMMFFNGPNIFFSYKIVVHACFLDEFLYIKKLKVKIINKSTIMWINNNKKYINDK